MKGMNGYKPSYSSQLPGKPVVGFPINRRRQPMAKEQHVSRLSDAEHAKAQKAAAEQTLKAQGAVDEDTQSAHVSTMLTTPEHVGKHPAEPHKDKELSLASTGIEDVSGVDKVKTVPRKTAGQTTDKVVVEPASPAVKGATAPVPGEAEKVRAAAKAAGSKRGKKFGKKHK